MPLFSGILETDTSKFLTKIDNYYYFQDPDNPQLNDYRIYSDGVYLEHQRYDGADWTEQFSLGGSIDVQAQIRIIRDRIGGISVVDENLIHNFIRHALFSEGTVIADIFGTTFIGTSDELIKYRLTTTPVFTVLQGDYSQEFTGTSFSMEYDAGSEDGYSNTEYKIKGTIPADTKAQVLVYERPDLVNPVYKSISDEEFVDGRGIPIDETTGILILSPGFYSLAGKELRIVINLSKESTIKGSTTDGTDMYLESLSGNLKFSEILDEDNLADYSVQSDWSQSDTGAVDYIKNKPVIGSGYMLSANNLSDVASAATARTNLGVDIAGTDNSTDVTLNDADTTQETLDLTAQELTVNVVTTTTDGAMIGEDKLKLDNMTGNGVADHWTSGLAVTEQSPKDQTVLYTAGTYLINGAVKTIASGGTYDLENGYGAINHYTGLTASQHRFVTLYVDTDEVIKSVSGTAADKKDVPDLPTTPTDSVPIALVEIKVDDSIVAKDIRNKDITDTRNAPAFNTDEFVKVSENDLGSGHLLDKLSNNGNVTFTKENAGGIETIKADASSSTISSMTYSIDAHVDGLDVSSIAPIGILRLNIAGNRELKSLSAGVDKQIVRVMNVIDSTVKVKHQAGTVSQNIRTEGGIDKIFGNYGGCELIYDETTSYWYLITSV